jgi:hypothetical protein
MKLCLENNIFNNMDNELSPYQNITKLKEILNNKKLDFDDRVILRMYLEYITQKPIYFDGYDLVDRITDENIQCYALSSRLNKDQLVERIQKWYEVRLNNSKNFLEYFENQEKTISL